MLSLPDYLDLDDRRIIASLAEVDFRSDGSLDQNGDPLIHPEVAIPLINGAWRELLAGPRAAMAREIDAMVHAALGNSSEESRLLRERKRIYALIREAPELAFHMRDALRAATSKIALSLQAKLTLIYQTYLVSFTESDEVNELNAARRQAVMHIRTRISDYYRVEAGSCPVMI